MLAPWPPSASFLRPSCLHVPAAPKPLRPPLPPAGVNVLNPHQGPGDPLFIFVSVLAEIALGGGEAADLVRINAN